MGMSQSLLQWASKGFWLLIASSPILHCHPNHCLDNLQEAFLNKEVKHLLQEQAIHLLCDDKPAMILPLGVVTKKNGKFHPIMDMRFLNSFLTVPKFKFKGLKELASIIHEGDWLVMIDFKDGFQHIEVHPDHQHLLGFEWQGVCYAFQVLPFGLSTSPWAFTHFVQATVSHLCQASIQILTYMDDLIILGSSHKETGCHVQHMLQVLADLGWLVNEEKSSLSPSQTLEFLGFIVDSTGPP